MAPAVKNDALGSGEGAPTVDLRTERWRQHRVERRRQLVDATFRAISENGPDVSMEQIAEAAGIGKPKIYRHFDDRADLVQAVCDRAAREVFERILTSLDPDASVRQSIRQALDAYLGFVELNPGIVRFLINGTGGDTASPLIDVGRMIARVFVVFGSADLEGVSASLEATEPLAHGLIGAIFGVTDWWVNQDEATRVSRDRVIGQLTEAVLGALNASLAVIGLRLDPDRPLSRDHFSAITTP